MDSNANLVIFRIMWVSVVEWILCMQTNSDVDQLLLNINSSFCDIKMEKLNMVKML